MMSHKEKRASGQDCSNSVSNQSHMQCGTLNNQHCNFKLLTNYYTKR